MAISKNGLVSAEGSHISKSPYFLILVRDAVFQPVQI